MGAGAGAVLEQTLGAGAGAGAVMKYQMGAGAGASADVNVEPHVRVCSLVLSKIELQVEKL